MARYSDTRGRPCSSHTFACTQTNIHTHTPAMSLAICHVWRSIISAINISCLFQTIRIAVIIPLPWDTTVTHFARQHNTRPHTLQRVTLPNRSLTNIPAMHYDTFQIHSHINAPLSKDNVNTCTQNYIMAWQYTALHCIFNLSERNFVMNTSDLHTIFSWPS